MKFCVVLCIFILDVAYGFLNLADVECGSGTSRLARIVGGEDSLPAEFPWTASIWRQGAHQCGATVITDQWLVTAGHCVCSVFDSYYKTKQLSIVVGERDLATNHEKESLSLIVPHPEYRCNKKTNDVALLKTARKLKWNKSLRPACLPQSISEDFSGNLATVAGWGFTDEDRGKGSRPNVLQKTNVHVVSNDQCNSWYQSKGSKVKIITTQLCAGHEFGGRDSCWADSGGPLMINEKGRSLVIGVVSTGNGCARPKQPGIYTRMTMYTSWIQETISSDSTRSGLNWWYPSS